MPAPTRAARTSTPRSALPLTILEARRGTEALVLEMAMRGAGQIAELAAIAEPDVGVIVNVGPVHLELLGTVERVAAAKAELIRDLPSGAACVVPAREPLLEAHLRDDLDTWTFGPGGQVQLLAMDGGRAEIEARGRPVGLELPYSRAAQPAQHARRGGRGAGRSASPVGGPVDVQLLLAARRGGRAAGRGGRGQRLLQRQPDVDARGTRPSRRSPAEATHRGAGHDGRARRWLAEPSTARWARTPAPGHRRARAGGRAALGYLEGFEGEAHAVSSPEEAAALLEELARPGDRVLVKGSRSVGPGTGARLSQCSARSSSEASASLLICMFLGPRFIEYLRVKEFGQHIREEGPAGHHGKAGTPTMGGLVILLAVCVPFLILSEYRAASIAVLGTALAMAALGFADDIIKLRKRRSLGVSGKTKLAVQAITAIALWLVATEFVGPARHAQPARGRRLDRPRAGLPGADLPGAGGCHQRREPDRRPRRARRGLLGHRVPGLHGHDLHHHGSGGPGAAVGLPGGRVRGLPVVQLLSRVGVHGGHRLARARRGHRGDSP